MAEFQFPANPTLNQQYLKWTWNGTSWVLSTQGDSIGDLSDVDITTIPPTENQLLVWNTVNWVPISLNDIGTAADLRDGGDFSQNTTSSISSQVYDGSDYSTLTTAAIDSAVLDGGLFVGISDTIFDGGLAVV